MTWGYRTGLAIAKGCVWASKAGLVLSLAVASTLLLVPQGWRELLVVVLAYAAVCAFGVMASRCQLNYRLNHEDGDAPGTGFSFVQLGFLFTLAEIDALMVGLVVLRILLFLKGI